MTLAYLYRWTEKSTGKWYVGSRYANGCHPDDGYICSSRIVKPMIMANRDGWEREILVVGYPKYIRDLEAEYLRKLDAAKCEMSYNKSNGNRHFHTIGQPLSEKQMENLLKRNPSKREDVKEKLRAFGKTRDNSHLYTEEANEKRRASQRKAWADGKYKGSGFKAGDENISKNPEVRKKISEALKAFKGGRMSGKTHSEETKRKMAEARRKYWERHREAQNYTL